jgi:hypothetical protein
LRWLGLGWRDMMQGRWLSLSHGVALTGFGLVLLIVAHRQFWLLAGAFSGFLVVAPVRPPVCMRSVARWPTGGKYAWRCCAIPG